MFEILWLPEVPSGDENLPFGLEMLFDLVKNKDLIFLGGEMVENSDTKDVVELRKTAPRFLLGDVGFNIFVIWVSTFCLIE